MKKAVHFGAGNIGRGFIGEILSESGFEIDFVDINEQVIDELKRRQQYDIELAEEEKRRIHIEHVNGINNHMEPHKVIEAIQIADIITTAIGPNVLPHIASLIAEGIKARRKSGVEKTIDVIACENMIGGSQFLWEEVQKYLEKEDQLYAELYIGFPNAAVDRIVPIQKHKDLLFVIVEPFSEWVVDESQMKNVENKLSRVLYVKDLEPYIERKLFSVNTGHATVAYAGAYYHYEQINGAIQDERVLNLLKHVLFETSQLLLKKWQFEEEVQEKYVKKIIARFKNPYISDSIQRVARTPIRKLGYDERFIRPIRELDTLKLDYDNLVRVTGMILCYQDSEDDQSVELQKMLDEIGVEKTVRKVTNLDNSVILNKIVQAYQQLNH